MHDTGHGLSENVLSTLMRVGTCQTETRADSVNQLRIQLGQFLIAKAHTFHHTGTKIVDDHIGFRKQFENRFLVTLLSQIKYD